MFFNVFEDPSTVPSAENFFVSWWNLELLVCLWLSNFRKNSILCSQLYYSLMLERV